MKMKLLLQLEEGAVFLLCIYLFSQLSLAWWWFPALLLVFDLGMLGYLVSPKVGAFTYNLCHHRMVAAVVAFYAITYGNEYWKFAAILQFAHISFDRIFGYGLKYSDQFEHTHMGWIGKKREQNA